MPQLSYTNEMTQAFAGMKADARFDEVESFQAVSALGFGLGVVRGDAYPESQARLPNVNNVVITDDAGTFTAGNIVATVNGTVLTQAWGTDKNTTMTALAAQIAANVNVDTAVYASGTHTITIVANDDIELTISVDVSGITGTMTISSTAHTSNDVFRGIALQTHQDNRTMPVLGASTFSATGYLANDPINVLRKGVAWVETADTVVENAAVYLITTGANKGKFTDDTTSPNIAVPTGKFRNAVTGAGIAKVEINIP
jgi:hypothetical protein